MRNKIFLFSSLITVFTICLLIESCKKDKKSSNSIIGKWTMTAYIHEGMDVFGTAVLPCFTDNIITFTSNLQVIADEGPTKCSPSDPQTITGTYSFNTDNTQLTVIGNGYTQVNYIRTLNSTTLKLEQTDNGDIITYTKVP